MAWIKLYTNLARHPKTVNFARMLDISIPTAAGHLVVLWTNVLEIKEDGDLTKYSQQNIADLADWKGNAAQFNRALVLSSLLDIRGKDSSRQCYIHDWKDYAEPYLRAKYALRHPEQWNSIKALLDQRKSFNPIPQQLTGIATEPISEDSNTPKPDSAPRSKSLPIKSKTLTGENLLRGDDIKKKKQERPRAKSNFVKIKHLECVFLTNDELSKLRILYSLNRDKIQDSHGDERLDFGIQKLNDYIMARGKTRSYKSHYHVLRGWVLNQTYEDEKRGILRFAKVVATAKYRTDLAHCDQCDQMIPIPEWDKHACNRSEEGIKRTSVTEAVNRLRDSFRKG